MIDDKREASPRNEEVEEMLAELEGRGVKSGAAEVTVFPARFQARGQKGAPTWPTSCTRGETPPPRWSARFIASGTKQAR